MTEEEGLAGIRRARELIQVACGTRPSRALEEALTALREAEEQVREALALAAAAGRTGAAVETRVGSLPPAAAAARPRGGRCPRPGGDGHRFHRGRAL